MEPHGSTQDRPSHDDVYAAVFNLVGQTPNETYEGLAKVLPSIKDSDPVELKELAARKALHELLNPPKDPLLLEYEKAAAEEDVDDLSTEDGEWLDATKQAKEGEVDEELDEHGIPVMKLSRASSSFILDGPGDVKVDNFTPEAQDGPDEGDAPTEGPAVLTPATANSAPAAAVADVAGSTTSGSTIGAAVAAGYVPSVISRAKGATAAGAAAAPAPVVTLEDEIRAMRAAAGGPRGPQPAAAAEPPPASAPAARATADGKSSPAGPELDQRPEGDGPASDAWPRRGNASGRTDDSGRGDVGDDDSDAPEVVPEPPGALLPPPTGGGTSRRLLLLRGDRAGDGAGSSEGSGGAGAGAAMAAGVDVDEGTCLPGTCQDSSREDALWAALQGVDGRALVEHMGLAEPDAGTFDQAEAEDDGGPQGSGATASVASTTTAAAAAAATTSAVTIASPTTESPPRTALPNGHLGGDGSDGGELGPGDSNSSGTAAGGSGGGGSSSGLPNSDAVEHATAALSLLPAGAAGGGAGGGGTGDGADGASAATNGEGSEAATASVAVTPPGSTATTGAAAAVGGGGGGSGMELALRRAVPVAAAAASSSPSGDGPTFESVEAFSLDPDFDYDNVQLTPREFPYSMLNARWAANGGFGARAAR